MIPVHHARIKQIEVHKNHTYQTVDEEDAYLYNIVLLSIQLCTYEEIV